MTPSSRSHNVAVTGVTVMMLLMLAMWAMFIVTSHPHVPDAGGDVHAAGDLTEDDHQPEASSHHQGEAAEHEHHTDRPTGGSELGARTLDVVAPRTGGADRGLVSELREHPVTASRHRTLVMRI